MRMFILHVLVVALGGMISPSHGLFVQTKFRRPLAEIESVLDSPFRNVIARIDFLTVQRRAIAAAEMTEGDASKGEPQIDWPMMDQVADSLLVNPEWGELDRFMSLYQLELLKLLVIGKCEIQLFKIKTLLQYQLDLLRVAKRADASVIAFPEWLDLDLVNAEARMEECQGVIEYFSIVKSACTSSDAVVRDDMSALQQHFENAENMMGLLGYLGDVMWYFGKSSISAKHDLNPPETESGVNCFDFLDKLRNSADPPTIASLWTLLSVLEGNLTDLFFLVDDVDDFVDNPFEEQLTTPLGTAMRGSLTQSDSAPEEASSAVLINQLQQLMLENHANEIRPQKVTVEQLLTQLNNALAYIDDLRDMLITGGITSSTIP